MHRYRMSLSAVCLSVLAALPAAARADDLEDLKRSHEELRRLVETQQKEIERLRGDMARGSEGAALAAAIADLSKASDNSGPVVWKQISKQSGSKFQMYGFLRLDMAHDTSRPNSTNLPAWIRSGDAGAPASIAAGQGSSAFQMHPRLTRLGFDFTGPNVAGLGDAVASAKLETDFYNASASSSRAALRMRHAYLKLTWCDQFTVLAGQTADLISPQNPIVNNDFVMWGAGNLGDRRPQVRAEWAGNLGDMAKIVVQGMAGDTGAVDARDLDPAATTGAGYVDGQMSGEPTWQGRVAGKFKNWDDKEIEVGIWGHTAREDVDTEIGDHGSFESRAVGVDVSIPLLTDQLWLKGELWTGQDLTDVRGGILQSINATTGDEINAQGGWIELGGKATPWMSLYAGFSFDDPNDHDLSSGGATGGRSLNKIWYLASRMNFDQIELGLEFLHWKTEFIGFDKGVDNRVAAFIAYKF